MKNAELARDTNAPICVKNVQTKNFSNSKGKIDTNSEQKLHAGIFFQYVILKPSNDG